MQETVKKLCYVSLAFMLAGCSSTPRVVADVTETLPAQSAEKVSIYEVDAEVPEEARAIGKVKVTDGGMTPTYNCLYGNMLALAVRKTAECGGNALHIDEHRKPNLASTCHRIWGTMYLLPDSLTYANAPNTIQQLEAENDAQLATMVREQISRTERMLDNPSDILKVNAGFSWITSEMQTPTRTYKSKRGFSAGVDYIHLWRKGLGFGINYLYHTTSFDEGFSIKMHYIGPSFVASMKLGTQWRFGALLGIGYSSYTERADGYMYGFGLSETKSGVGVLGQLGLEYMLSKQVGLGLQMNTFTMSLERPSGFDTDRYDFYGIRRVDLQLGLRFYLGR